LWRKPPQNGSVSCEIRKAEAAGARECVPEIRSSRGKE